MLSALARAQGLRVGARAAAAAGTRRSGSGAADGGRRSGMAAAVQHAAAHEQEQEQHPLLLAAKDDAYGERAAARGQQQLRQPALEHVAALAGAQHLRATCCLPAAAAGRPLTLTCINTQPPGRRRDY